MASYGSMPCDGPTSTCRAYGLILRRDELADRVRAWSEARCGIAPMRHCDRPGAAGVGRARVSRRVPAARQRKRPAVAPAEAFVSIISISVPLAANGLPHRDCGVVNAAPHFRGR